MSQTLDITCRPSAEGQYGCFFCDPVYAMSWRGVRIYPVYGDGRVSSQAMTHEERRALLKSGVCFKIFKPKHMPQAFEAEIQAMTTLKGVLGGTLFKSHTTFAGLSLRGRTYYAFQLVFPSSMTVTMVHGNGERWRVTGSVLHVMTFNGCRWDLKEMQQRASAQFDPRRFLKDVRPVLRALHARGYSHMDIKPRNVVFCPEDPVQYKLIDFNVYTHEERMRVSFPFTARYLLPRIQEHWQRRDELFNDAHDNDVALSLQNTHSLPMSMWWIKSDDYAVAMMIRVLTRRSPAYDTVVHKLLSAKPVFLS